MKHDSEEALRVCLSSWIKSETSYDTMYIFSYIQLLKDRDRIGGKLDLTSVVVL